MGADARSAGAGMRGAAAREAFARRRTVEEFAALLYNLNEFVYID